MAYSTQSIRSRRRNRVRSKTAYRPPNNSKPGRLDSGGGR